MTLSKSKGFFKSNTKIVYSKSLFFFALVLSFGCEWVQHKSVCQKNKFDELKPKSK